MRLDSLLIGVVALSACERRAPPAPVAEVPPPPQTAAPVAPPPPAVRLPPQIEELRVVLASEATIAKLETSGAAIIRRPWAGPIVQVLAADGADDPEPVRKQPGVLQTAVDTLFAAGLANLRKACPQPIAGDRTIEGRSHVWISRFADNYTSARLLLSELWEKIAAEGHGHLYAAVPARDILLWTTSTAKDDQAGFRAQARTAFQSRSYPISPAILRWAGRGWKLEDANPVP